MEQWQREALDALFATTTTQVEEGSRVYVSSKTYGDSRFHLLSKKYDSIQIEQINIDEKWGSRVNLQSDELPAILNTLLIWYLDDARRRSKAAGVSPINDDLSDVDEAPF